MWKKLEIGFSPAFRVRTYDLPCLPPGSPTRSLAYLSDLHLRSRRGVLVDRVLETLEEIRPDVVLLGGDYVDTAGGLLPFTRLLSGLTDHPHRFLIAGNHDRFLGMNRLRRLAGRYRCPWLEAAPVSLYLGQTRLLLAAQDQPLPRADVRILLQHAPRPARHPFDLVLGGHLHGGQCVLWRRGDLNHPAGLVYRRNFAHRREGGTLYVNSFGLGDTLPLRYDCPRDFLFVRLTAVPSP